MHGRLRRHVRLATVPRHIQKHSARDESAGERRDICESCSAGVEFLVWIATVPHPVLVPYVTQRIDVRHRETVVHESVVVDDEPPVWRSLDKMLLGFEDAAERDSSARLHQCCCIGALLSSQEIDGTHLIVRAQRPQLRRSAYIACAASRLEMSCRTDW